MNDLFKSKQDDKKDSNNKYTSALNDYSKLDPALMDALLDFEKEDEPPAETLPESQPSSNKMKTNSSKITFNLSTSNEVPDDKLTDSNALEDLCLNNQVQDSEQD